LDSASLFQLYVVAEIEGIGKEYGTVYDRSTVCAICSVGERQLSDLILDLRKMPKSKDIAATLASEIVVSQRLAELLSESPLSGFELRRVYHKIRYDEDSIDPRQYPSGRELLRRATDAGYPYPAGKFWVWLNRREQADLVQRLQREHVQRMERRDIKKPKQVWPPWYQLVITSQPLELVPPTKFGIDPFDEDLEGRYRCPLGHVKGLNILSEAYVSSDAWDGSDFVESLEFIGSPPSESIPVPRYKRLMFISPRVRRFFIEHKIRGWEVEIAHLIHE
jgi:hypothetical protein